MKKTHIGVLSEHFINWGGGIDFIRLILNSLTSIDRESKNEINIYVFIPKQSYSKIKIKNKLKTVINTFTNKKHQLQKIIPKQSIVNSFISINDSIKIIFYNNSEAGLVKLVQKHNIDFIIPVFSPLSASFPIPWIGYIYDFQHKYYPEFFSEEEIKLRDSQFLVMLNKANTIIVNAKSVKKDVNKFYGKTKSNKVVALPFCPVLNDDFFKTNTDIEKYNLPNKYFMVSNQFWKHKDHKTAFRAFKLFLDNHQHNKDIALVCTGQTHDFRFPNYFEELKELISELELDKNIFILGYIPKIDQLQILKKCIAVIQPTLFEGGPGGFSVFESVAYGIPSIVSDISVNKEIEDETVTFFKTGSAIHLSKTMLSVFQKEKYQYSIDELVIKNNKSLFEMGENILNILNK
jgi:glycosyltransferase involved in cell wall biosynthesis